MVTVRTIANLNIYIVDLVFQCFGSLNPNIWSLTKLTLTEEAFYLLNIFLITDLDLTPFVFILNEWHQCDQYKNNMALHIRMWNQEPTQ